MNFPHCCFSDFSLKSCPMTPLHIGQHLPANLKICLSSAPAPTRPAHSYFESMSPNLILSSPYRQVTIKNAGLPQFHLIVNNKWSKHLCNMPEIKESIQLNLADNNYLFLSCPKMVLNLRPSLMIWAEVERDLQVNLESL